MNNFSLNHPESDDDKHKFDFQIAPFGDSKNEQISGSVEPLEISSSIDIDQLFANPKIESKPPSQKDTVINADNDVPEHGFIREDSSQIEHEKIIKIEPKEVTELSIMGHHIQVRNTEAGMSFTLLEADTQYFLEPGKKFFFGFDNQNNLHSVQEGKHGFCLSCINDGLEVTVYDPDFFVSYSTFDPLKYSNQSFEKLPEMEKHFVLSHRHTLSLECLQAFRDNAMLEADIDGLPARIYRGYRISAGGFGKIFNGFYCRDGRLHQCVIKEGYPHSDFRKFFDYERDRSAELKMLRERESDKYPDSLLKILAITDNHIVMDKCFHPRYGTMDLLDYSKTKKYSALPIAEKVDHLIDIAKALKYLHKNRYVHFDVKPPNAIIFADRVVLGDFGLLSSMDDKSRQKYIFCPKKDSFLGTKNYLNKDLDQQRQIPAYNDIYAFGITVKWLLKQLFDAKFKFDSPRWDSWKLLLQMCTQISEDCCHLMVDSFDRILDLLDLIKEESVKYDKPKT